MFEGGYIMHHDRKHLCLFSLVCVCVFADVRLLFHVTIVSEYQGSRCWVRFLHVNEASSCSSWAHVQYTAFLSRNCPAIGHCCIRTIISTAKTEMEQNSSHAWWECRPCLATVPHVAISCRTYSANAHTSRYNALMVAFSSLGSSKWIWIWTE